MLEAAVAASPGPSEDGLAVLANKIAVKVKQRQAVPTLAFMQNLRIDVESGRNSTSVSSTCTWERIYSGRPF
jgi:hypothetical protein